MLKAWYNRLFATSSLRSAVSKVLWLTALGVRSITYPSTSAGRVHAPLRLYVMQCSKYVNRTKQIPAPLGTCAPSTWSARHIAPHASALPTDKYASTASTDASFLHLYCTYSHRLGIMQQLAPQNPNIAVWPQFCVNGPTTLILQEKAFSFTGVSQYTKSLLQGLTT